MEKRDCDWCSEELNLKERALKLSAPETLPFPALPEWMGLVPREDGTGAILSALLETLAPRTDAREIPNALLCDRCTSP